MRKKLLLKTKKKIQDGTTKIDALFMAKMATKWAKTIEEYPKALFLKR